MKQGYDRYRTTSIETADQGKLILIAYDVAIKHCKLAVDNINTGDYKLIEERTKHLYRAQDAINELMGALRLDVGEIAKNLYRLYNYMIRRLIEANIRGDVPKITEVVGHLETLREAWSEAILKLKRESAPVMEKTESGVTVMG